MTRRNSSFKDEAELCAAFIAGAVEQGWTSYAETKGYDIVLARGGIRDRRASEAAFQRHIVTPDFAAALRSRSGERASASSGHFAAVLRRRREHDL
ncbi:MAG: hypothetical protein QM811_08755 [Pirellulales bacterium]